MELSGSDPPPPPPDPSPPRLVSTKLVSVDVICINIDSNKEMHFTGRERDVVNRVRPTRVKIQRQPWTKELSLRDGRGSVERRIWRPFPNAFRYSDLRN